MLVGLVGVCVGVYALLDKTAPRILALPMLLAGVVGRGGRAGQRRPPRAAHPLPARPLALRPSSR